jgi:hypothetical protein
MFTVANMLDIYVCVLLARRFAPTLNLASVEGACRFLVSAAVVGPHTGGPVRGRHAVVDAGRGVSSTPPRLGGSAMLSALPCCPASAWR